MTNGVINLIGCTVETNGIGIKLDGADNVTLNLTDCRVSAAVLFKFGNSSDCELNLKGGELNCTGSGDEIVYENSTNIVINCSD